MPRYAACLVLALALGCAFLVPAPARAQNVAFNLAQGRVSVTVPSTWQVMQQGPQGAAELVLLALPGGKAVNSNDANALVLVTANAQGLDVAAFSTPALAQHLAQPSTVVLADETNGQWRTVYWVGMQGSTQYMIADRFAASGDLLVQCRVSWPLLSGDASAVLIDQTNGMLSSLSLDGQQAPSGPLLSLEPLPAN